MKVLLVNPHIPIKFYNREFYFPSGLMYLASSLIKNGDDTKILDLKIYQRENDPPDYFFEKKILDEVSEYNPDLIGFGTLFSGNFPDVLNYSIAIKKNFPNIPIVVGGIHPTLYYQEILDNCSSIDYICLGESEISIVQLTDAIKNKSGFEKIPGFAFRKNANVFVNPKLDYIDNVDNIPFPAYDLVDIKDYYVDTSFWHNPKKFPINTSVPIITSRSCPYKCTFCSMYKVMGPKWRARSPKNVVDEIELVYHKFNHRHFSFMDDNLTLSKERIINICKEIKNRGLDIQFETPNGISIKTIDKEVLDSMVDAGLVRTYLAIESGSDYIRNVIMKKGLVKEKICEVAKLAKEYKDLAVNAFFIIGMPEETKETLEETYNMIKEIEFEKTIVMNIVPFPGTKVFDQAIRDNLLVDVEPEALYLKSDRYFTNYDRFFLKPYKLTLDDLHEFRVRLKKLIDEQMLKYKEKRRLKNEIIQA